MRIIFAGTGEIGIPCLRYLSATRGLVGVLTQPDRPAGRHRELKPPAIKDEIQRLDPLIPLIQPESPRLPEVRDWFKQLAPEVMVTMAYGRILPTSLLEAPSLACLNIHASLLPRHRGASPIQAAIASGDRETGITIMYMAEGLDTGDILLEKRILIRRRETAGSLSERLALIAPTALAEALELVAHGKAPRIVQNHSQATLTGKISREDCLLNWNCSARELERKIRSLQPRPGAVGLLPLLSGEKVLVKIHSAILIRRLHGIPGTLLRSDARGVLIACGSEALLLGTIQPDGRGRMPSSAFARGYALALTP